MKKEKSKIAIDKIILGNFVVQEIKDIEKLEMAGIVSVEKKAEHYAIDNLNNQYNNIHIRNSQFFDDFYYGRNKLSGNYYGKLEISVYGKSNHNLDGWTIDELKNHIEKIQKYLEEMGIIVDFQFLKIKRIELNKTIMLENECCNYHRVLKQIIKLLPKNLQKTQYIYNDDENNYTYYSGSSTTEVKIYNKTGQLEKAFNILLEDNYLRFEIVLSGYETIINNLKTNLLSEITQEEINNYFISFINNNVIKTHDVWIEKSQKYIIKIIKQKLKVRNTWDEVIESILSDELSNEIPLLLDYENLINLLDKIKSKNKQSKYKAKKRIKEIVIKNAPILNQNDTKKYIEIIEKLVNER